MYEEWIRRGRQRQAVILAIKKPMTGKQILESAIKMTPHIRLRDISKILKDLISRGLVIRLNGKEVTGTLYWLTGKGIKTIANSFNTERSTRPRGVDWKAYALLMRGKARRKVFIELKDLCKRNDRGCSVSEIRKSMNTQYPIAMNATIRAVRELKDCGLIESQELSKKRNTKLYRLTDQGQQCGKVLEM